MPYYEKSVSAREAFDAGLTRYFTGKPCKRGHIAERMVSNGVCHECLSEVTKRRRESVKQWRKDNPEKLLEQGRRYAAKHPETAEKSSAKYRSENADKIRDRARDSKRRMRLINPEMEKARLAKFYAKRESEKSLIAGRERPAVCDICGEFNRQICFDHCHSTGLFRGWLCDRCNKTLGIVKDSPELLRSLADYLEKNNGLGKTERAA